MKNINEEWFVREEIAALIDKNILDIVRSILDNEIDYEDSDELLNCSSDFIKDIEDFTADEIDHLIFWLQLYCAVDELRAEGMVSVIDGKIQLIEDTNV